MIHLKTQSNYEKQKSFQINLRIPFVWLRPEELGCRELYAIVSSRYLKHNNEGGCSGNLAEQPGDAGVVILWGKSVRKLWFLKSKGAGETPLGRECCDSRAVKRVEGPGMWVSKVSLRLLSSLKTRADASLSPGIPLWGSSRVRSKNHRGRVRALKGDPESLIGKTPSFSQAEWRKRNSLVLS